VATLGSSGTPKPTCATQLLRAAIEQGEQALYVMLDERLEQIMREPDAMVASMREYSEKSPFFIHLKGRDFKKVIQDELPHRLHAGGVGVVVRSRPTDSPEEESRSHIGTFEEAIKTGEAMKAPARVVERIKKMQRHWDYDYSPEETLQILFSSYGLKRGG